MNHFIRIIILFCGLINAAHATNLLEVYHQALLSDPTYQQAIAQQFETREGVPIALSSLLPSANVTVSPFYEKETSSGSASNVVGDFTSRGYNVNLTATQTIFNFAQFAAYAQSKATARQAVATLNAASQDLMIRVAKAYFQILQDEDILRASDSAKIAFAKQLDQVTQQYKVGLKTITDVYTAQASYEGSVATYIAAETALANDRENLRAITGKLYTNLDKLSEKFPLISPKPNNIETWVQTSIRQNWQVKALECQLQAARINIKQQFAGHIPTLAIQDTYAIHYEDDVGGSQFDVLNPPGTLQTHTNTVQLNLNVPIVQGGLVVAQTRQAKYQFQVAAQQLESQFRATMNATRQSFLNIEAGISKIKADVKTIKSAKSSLEGMQEGYRVGTEILVNVLNQQQQVLSDEEQYAADRYAYVNDLLLLKQAAGTLCPDDLAAINAWLVKDSTVYLNSVTKSHRTAT